MASTDTAPRQKTKTVVAKVSDVKPGGGIYVTVNGRDIALFNVDGTFHAISNRCPHEGANLCTGRLTGLLESDRPGSYRLSRRGEMVRCPWHGWEFDLVTGQSYCDPKRTRVRNYAVSVESGSGLIEGPYKVETFPISIEEDYVIIET